MSALSVTSPGRVFLDDRAVHIHQLVTADPDLVALVAASHDPEAVVHQVLSAGSRALAVAQASIDTMAVEQSFERLVHRLSQQLEEANARLVGTTGELLNHPDHGITANLQTWRRDMDTLLDATFNPTRSTSALGALDAMLKSAATDQENTTRRLLNPDVDDSPLARVLTGVREQISTVLDAVSRIGEQVAAEKAATTATAATLERSAVKGQAYEIQVVDAVTALAAAHGEVAEAVGRQEGSGAKMAGDIIVEVGPATGHQVSGRYVLECKDRRLTLKSTLEELRRAADNREAQASIAVFSRLDHAPTREPLVIFDNQAIIVYDKENPDPAALRIACAWARWIIDRQRKPERGPIDRTEIERIVEDARRTLAHRTVIRRAHSSAVKRIQEAATYVDDLHEEVLEIIERLERATNPASATNDKGGART